MGARNVGVIATWVLSQLGLLCNHRKRCSENGGQHRRFLRHLAAIFGNQNSLFLGSKCWRNRVGCNRTDRRLSQARDENVGPMGLHREWILPRFELRPGHGLHMVARNHCPVFRLHVPWLPEVLWISYLD
jgi:hypothetical protein